MKKCLITLLGAAMIVACSKENAETISPEISDAQIVVSEEERGLSEFAIILSRAINQEPELRAFIKKEALKEFDKDYDVFYPFVKDKKVEGDRTFRDILLDYDDNKELPSIEDSLPLLDILVPDWSWIADDCFSVRRWDIEQDRVCVTFRTSGKEQRIYNDGKSIGFMSRASVPSYPILVVKNNERMRTKSILTRGSLCSNDYDFIDEVYNNNGATRGSGGEFGNEWYLDAQIEEDPETIPVEALSGRVATAYYQNGVPQRDHIYYGMTETCDSGRIDYNYQETIYRIKIKAPVSAGYYDDTTDFTLREHRKTGKTATFTEEELRELIWADGSLELMFVIKAGDKKIDSKPFPISFSEAFQIKKYTLVNKYNWLGAKKSIYASIEKGYLVPRWVNVNIPLFSWDIRFFPQEYSIIIFEHDSGITTTVTTTVEEEFMSNSALDITGSYKTDLKIGFDQGEKATEKRKITYSYQKTENSDSLGTLSINYRTDVITGFPSSSCVKIPIRRAGGVDVQMLSTRL